MSNNMQSNVGNQLYKVAMAQLALLKQGFVPVDPNQIAAAQQALSGQGGSAPGPGGGAGGGAPPMDPSMMGGAGGGAPPMDPSMMGGADGGAGGPPMDPSMMGGAGGPPMDPSAGGAPPTDPAAAVPPPTPTDAGAGGPPPSMPGAAPDTSSVKDQIKQVLEETGVIKAPKVKPDASLSWLHQKIDALMGALSIPIPAQPEEGGKGGDKGGDKPKDSSSGSSNGSSGASKSASAPTPRQGSVISAGCSGQNSGLQTKDVPAAVITNEGETKSASDVTSAARSQIAMLARRLRNGNK